MKLKLNGLNTPPTAEVLDNCAVIVSVNDGLDLIAQADYLGARQVVAHDYHFSTDFFNLTTGLAGDVLQKFVNYRMQLVIIGDWASYRSRALQDFIRECNRGTAFSFVTGE